MASHFVRHVFGRTNIINYKHVFANKSIQGIQVCALAQNMGLHIRTFSSASDRFEEAKLKLKTVTEEPGDDIKLKLYSLFKQIDIVSVGTVMCHMVQDGRANDATIGTCNSSRPSVLDFVGRAKWDAWNSLGSMTQDEAKDQYATLVNELTSPGQSSESLDNRSSTNEQMDLLISKQDNVTSITLNRPEKMNALTSEMYDGIAQALNTAANDDTVIAVLRGTGDYFCSGNDLTNFVKHAGGNIPEIAKASKELLQRYVAAFIDFPKPLIVAVNGPAIGISVTVMALCDVVYASDKATFHTPFSELGQSPEGCSTYLFPKLMGYSKAVELLLFNKKITSTEAMERGIVSEVIPHDKFATEIESRIQKMSKLPKNSLIYSKQLIRGIDKDLLHKVNEAECERLMERWQSPDCMNAIMKFMSRKSAL